MIRKKAPVILLIISLIGFSYAFQLKYMKTYLRDVQIKELSGTGDIGLRNLNLAENIQFLEKLNHSAELAGRPWSRNDSMNQYLQRLKIINIISLVSMFSFAALCLYSTRRLLLQKITPPVSRA